MKQHQQLLQKSNVNKNYMKHNNIVDVSLPEESYVYANYHHISNRTMENVIIEYMHSEIAETPTD